MNAAEELIQEIGIAEHINVALVEPNWRKNQCMNYKYLVKVARQLKRHIEEQIKSIDRIMKEVEQQWASYQATLNKVIGENYYRNN